MTDVRQPAVPASSDRNQSREPPTTRMVSVRFALLHELQTKQIELETFVRVFIAANERAERGANVAAYLRQALDAVRGDALKGGEFWGRMRTDLERIGELANVRAVDRLPHNLAEGVPAFDEQLAQAFDLVNIAANPTQAGDPAEIVNELWACVSKMNMISGQIARSCKVKADEGLEDIQTLLVRIFERIEGEDDIARFETAVRQDTRENAQDLRATLSDEDASRKIREFDAPAGRRDKLAVSEQWHS
jgi:hypothetical protein